MGEMAGIGKTRKVDSAFEQDPKAWLEKKAEALQLQYLLVHADDGVIWGKYNSNGLTVSSEAFAEQGPDRLKVKLSSRTLQTARLFGPQGELYLWRTSEGFDYREIVLGDEEDTLEDVYWLWGTGAEHVNEFTLMKEGQQGFFHGLPVPDVDEKTRYGLRVRHLIRYEAGGQAYIAASRLVALEPVEGGAA